MAERILLADKPTLDSVKYDTSAKYLPANTAFIAKTVANTPVDIINVTGEGILNAFLAKGLDITYEIFIDGIKIFTRRAESNHTIGLIPFIPPSVGTTDKTIFNILASNNVQNTLELDATNSKVSSFSSDKTGGITFLHQPIHFKSSLVIKGTSPGASRDMPGFCDFSLRI